MRTTLDIDDAMLNAVRSLARQRQRSMGQIVSELIRVALVREADAEERNGLPVLRTSEGSVPVSMDLVNSLRDGELA